MNESRKKIIRAMIRNKSQLMMEDDKYTFTVNKEEREILIEMLNTSPMKNLVEEIDIFIKWLEDPERYNPEKDDESIKVLKLLKMKALE